MFVTTNVVKADALQIGDIILIDNRFVELISVTTYSGSQEVSFVYSPVGMMQKTWQTSTLNVNLNVMLFQWKSN